MPKKPTTPRRPSIRLADQPDDAPEPLKELAYMSFSDEWLSKGIKRPGFDASMPENHLQAMIARINAQAWDLLLTLVECDFETAESLIAANPPTALVLRAFVAMVEGQQFKRKQSAAGRKAQKAKARIKEWIVSEWRKHADGYERNKSAFARHYAARAKREFGEDVTHETIRTRWLKGL